MAINRDREIPGTMIVSNKFGEEARIPDTPKDKPIKPYTILDRPAEGPIERIFDKKVRHMLV